GKKVKSQSTSLYRALANKNQLTTVDLSGLDTSNITNMSEMFVNSASIQKMNLKGWQTSNVQNMSGMFKGVKTKIPSLLPILKPESVADKIVEAINKGKERLILPPFAGLAGFIANSPVFLADRIENIFGINSCMDEFVGRKKEND
ncbi:MAG: BspA family leucine-rich repeat surface protein, partial [Aeriscardovia sp.]|nr:BspA family leucine-rich repeat surface protein [Aeriscardovia sp.]